MGEQEAAFERITERLARKVYGIYPAERPVAPGYLEHCGEALRLVLASDDVLIAKGGTTLPPAAMSWESERKYGAPVWVFPASMPNKEGEE